jgi:hypothetical protein
LNSLDIKIICFLVFFPVAESLAQGKDRLFDVGGYVKYLFSYSDIPALGSLSDHLLHGRLDTKWYASDAFSLACEIRARAYYGGTVEQTPQFINFIRNTHDFARLDAVLWNSKSSVGYAEIDRLWAEWNEEPWQITVGRQRCAFGTNLVWNPTDLFNPYSILDFDYEERPGFDGARVQYYLGPTSKIEIATKPGKTSSTAATAAALTMNAAEFDFHLLVARRNALWLLGGSWAGDIAGSGFRGEVTISQKPKRTISGTFDANEVDGTMMSVALSGDYTFPSSLYLHVESLYNSEGVVQSAGLFSQQAQALGLLSPARWSLFGEISYDITPLLRGSLFAVHNPTDHSLVVVPSITWSVATDLDFTAIVLLFRGDPLTEFGGYGEIGYLRLKLSF